MENLIDPGTQAILTWESTDASDCEASGGWAGRKELTGSEQVGPLNDHTTFTLTCTGSSGSAVAMTTVSVAGIFRLNWMPPSANEDGSPLADLAGYKVYYGHQPRNYSDSVAVDDPASTSAEIRLVAGEYYVAMTATNGAGDESEYSNEVLKSAE